MTMQGNIQSDLKKAMLAKEESKVSALRVLIGEFQRQGKKELSDQEVMGVIRKLVKSEMETLEKQGGGRSDYLEVLEGYLPKQPTEQEIREWIDNNIDLSNFKNKMQAMKPIMTHYAGTADGNLVRQILESL